MYSFILPDFEGPLDLLLQLIEHRELDITKLSLATVTDQYLELINQPHNIELSQLADYLVIAAKLILIKSRLLLPHPEETPPEEEDVGDALARQLREYRMFKKAALFLRERARSGLRSYPRLAPPPRPNLANRKLEGVSAEDLTNALEQAFRLRPGLPQGTLEVPLRVSIQQKIDSIVGRIKLRPRVRFSHLLQEARTRVEVVVTFLAVLELIKLRRIDVQQSRIFGEIVLLRRKDGIVSPEPIQSASAEDYTID